MKHAAPGGYVEFQDWGAEVLHTSGIVPEESYIRRYFKLMFEAVQKSGRQYLVSRTIKERMFRLGFEDIQERVYILPFGNWPKDKHMKELGRIGQFSLIESLSVYSAELFSMYQGMKQEEIQSLCDEAMSEIKSTKGYYTNIISVYGRKPLDIMDCT